MQHPLENSNRKMKTDNLEKNFYISTNASTNAINREHNECQTLGNLVAQKLAKYSSDLQIITQQENMNIYD